MRGNRILGRNLPADFRLFRHSRSSGGWGLGRFGDRGHGTRFGLGRCGSRRYRLGLGLRPGLRRHLGFRNRLRHRLVLLSRSRRYIVLLSSSPSDSAGIIHNTFPFFPERYAAIGAVARLIRLVAAIRASVGGYLNRSGFFLIVILGLG